MNLEEIITTEEKSAVANLIAANLALVSVELRLQRAKEELSAAALELTTLWWKLDENDEGVSTMPQSFVIYHDGQPYLIRLDEDGNHAHEISPIGGVLGSGS